jgi:hypothetical protein
MGKRTFGVAAIGLAAMLFAGCGVAFKGAPGGEQTSKKKVKVSFTLCKEDEGACDTWNSSDENRLLVGFRVPKKTKPPQEFASSSGLPIQLTRSASYKTELNQKAPKGKKYKWFGYLSDVLDLGAEDEAGFAVKMKLPRNFKPKRFKVRPVAGFTDGDVTEIACGDDIFEPEGPGGANSVCIYAPLESELNDNLKIKIKKQKRN